MILSLKKALKLRSRQPAALFFIFPKGLLSLSSLLSGQLLPVDWSLYCAVWCACVCVFSNKASLAKGHNLIRQRKVPLTDTDLVIAAIASTP